MSDKKRRNAVDLFPLSCNPSLDAKSISGIYTYYTHLRKAFNNSRIRNIAISGQHGVGKSSLIKSFDATGWRLIKRKPKFLYVSMGQYHQPKSNEQSDKEQPNQHTYTGTMSDGFGEYKIILDLADKGEGGDSKNQQLDEQNAIERRILMQLCSKFKGRFFPASSFRLIPEKPGCFLSFGSVLCIMAAVLLLMKQPLADLLCNWTPQITWVNWLLGYMLKWNDDIEVMLYILVIAGIATVIWHSFQWFWAKGRNSSFGIKTSNVEWSVGNAECGDFLDQYTQELVYCLANVGREIDYTVVFEDMDRLEENIAIPIFMRLREINHILNARMNRNTYIRFVYVIKDEMVELLDYSKFFDFIIPVVPTLNQKSAEMIFGENLMKINAAIEKIITQQCKKAKDKSLLEERKCDQCTRENCVSVKCFYKDMETDNAEIVQWAAGALADYRKMYTILNEYSLALRLYFSNNRKKLTCQTAKQILAFYIYKHVWPKDYLKLITNSADTGFLTGNLTDGDHKDLFQKLYEAGLLNLDSLYYSGFSREKISDIWRVRLEGKDVKRVMDAIIQAEGYSYPEIQALVKNRCAIKPGQDDELSEDVLVAAIQFVLKMPTEQKDPNSWFFAGRDSDVCIGAIAKLSDKEIKRFIKQCKTEEKYDIFQKCSLKGEKVVHNDSWTEAMAKVYAWGVHPESRSEKTVMIEGKAVYFSKFDA